MSKPTYKKSTVVVLCNKINNDVVRGTLLDTQDIDGKLFYVIEQNGRIIKLAKDSYSTVRS